MAIIDEGDFDLFVDCYNLKRHGVYSALNWSFLVWGISTKTVTVVEGNVSK